MAYAVAQRRIEFGIRLALGAAPRDLVRLVGLQSLRLTAAGIVLGLAGAWLTSSLLGDLVRRRRARPTRACSPRPPRFLALVATGRVRRAGAARHARRSE